MPSHLAGQGRWLERVQVARWHWRRDEQTGGIRSAGWWESVTVTWTPAATPPSRCPWLHRALATAVETLGPPAAELVAATAWRLLDGWQQTRLWQRLAPSPAARDRRIRQLAPVVRAARFG